MLLVATTRRAATCRFITSSRQHAAYPGVVARSPWTNREHEQKRCAASTSRLPSSTRPSRVTSRTSPSPKSKARHPNNGADAVSKETSEGVDGALHATLAGKKAPAKERDALVVDSLAGQDRGDQAVKSLDMAALLAQDTLVITREIEFANIVAGYEVANKYAINTADGQLIGYLAETGDGFMGKSVQRQLLRTHRPFEAHVLDTQGNIIMIVRRPFTLINSKVSIYTVDPATKRETLVGQVRQIFHLFHRKYELFLRREGEDGQDDMEQFAEINEGIWAWDFMLKDGEGRPLGAISRNFRGWGKEIFTDAGQYVLAFDPTKLTSDARIEDQKEQEQSTSTSSSSSGQELMVSGPARQLSTQERAVALATAISADFDYFSRHSHGGSGSFLPYWMMGSGFGGQADPVPQGGELPRPGPQTQDTSDLHAPPPMSGAGGKGADAGTAAGYDLGSQSQAQQWQQDPWSTGPTGSPSSYDEQGGQFGSPASPPDDFGQGQEDTWGGEQDPWSEQSHAGESSSSSWGWTDIFGGDS